MVLLQQRTYKFNDKQIQIYNLLRLQIYMLAIFTLIFIFIITLIQLSNQIPNDVKIAMKTKEKHLILADEGIKGEVLVAFHENWMSIKKNSGDGLFELMQTVPICQVSTFQDDKSAIYSKNSQNQPIYNILMGCKNGVLDIYEIKLQEEKLTKIFSENFEKSILKIISGNSSFPYHLVAIQGKIALFDVGDYQKILEVPTEGPFSNIIYDTSNHMVIITDKATEIRIQITSSQTLKVNRQSIANANKQILKAYFKRLLQNSTCGNGIVESGQQCDFGDTVNGDGCSSTCQIQFCGDGIVNNGEACDEVSAGCINCTLACGNGNIDPGQECDPGNNTNSTDCLNNCTAVLKSSYRTALGVGLGVGFLGLVGVVVGTSVAPAGAGVAGSLIGINPAGQVASALPTGAVSEGAKIFQPL